MKSQKPNKIWKSEVAFSVLYELNRRNPQYGSAIAKNQGIGYSYIVHVKKALIESGLIVTAKSGRVVLFKITDKGRELFHHLRRARKLSLPDE